MRLFILLALEILISAAAANAEEGSACKGGYFIRRYGFCATEPPVYAEKDNSWACTPTTRPIPGKSKLVINKTLFIAGNVEASSPENVARGTACEGRIPIEVLKDVKENAKEYAWRMRLAPVESVLQDVSIAYLPIRPGKPVPGIGRQSRQEPVPTWRTCQLQITLTYGGADFESQGATPTGCRHPAHGFDDHYFHAQKKCGLSDSKSYLAENEKPGDRADGEVICMTADKMLEETDAQKAVKIDAIRENLRLTVGPNDRRDGRIEAMSAFEITRLISSMSARDPSLEKVAKEIEAGGLYTSLWLYTNPGWKGGSIPAPPDGTGPAQFHLKIADDAINKAIAQNDRDMLDNIRKHLTAEYAIMQKSYFNSRFVIPQERFLFLYSDPRQTLVTQEYFSELDGQFRNAKGEAVFRVSDALARSRISYARDLRARHLNILAARQSLKQPDTDLMRLFRELGAQGGLAAKQLPSMEKEFDDLAGRESDRRQYLEKVIKGQLRVLWQEEQRNASELKALASSFKKRSNDRSEQAVFDAYVALYDMDGPGVSQALRAVKEGEGSSSQPLLIKWSRENLLSSAKAASEELIHMRAVLNQGNPGSEELSPLRVLSEIAAQPQGAVDTKLPVLVDTITRDSGDSPASELRGQLSSQMEQSYGAFIKEIESVIE